MSRIKKRQSNTRVTGGIAGLISRIPGALKSTFTETNIMVLITVIGLTIFGIIMVFSAGFYSAVNFDEPDPAYYLKKQGMFAILGFILLVIATNIDYHLYVRYDRLIIGASVIMLLILMTPLGVTVNGATRWINVGFTLITPSEISKICVILWTSIFFVKHPRGARCWVKNGWMNGLIPVAIVMGVHGFLIYKQPNLSTAIVVCVIIIAISIVAGMNLIYIGGVAGLGAAGVAAILTFGRHTHWYERITTFMDPFADAQGGGYQVSQGIIALGNGGLKGLGWGNSVAKNLYLPEPQNDFILAIIGEELGFIGFLVLMAVFMYLIYQGFSIALKAKDRLGCYIATGITVMLALHVIINVAVVTSTMPATGITLPFISYGGTSLLMFMLGIGILLNVSKGQRSTPLISIKATPEKIKRKRRRKRIKREAIS